MPLTTSVLHDDALALLALEGELDVAAVGRVDAAVAQVVGDGFRYLVLDVQHLGFCDSSGLGAMLRAHRTLRDVGGACVVAGARGSVRRLLLLTSMERVLHLADDVAVALEQLGSTAAAVPDEPLD